MRDQITDISTPEQHKALAHPTRHRLLSALDQPATISQLALALDTHKGNIGHHLKVLVAGGLVQAAGTRTVRGGTERYYERVTPALRVEGAAVAAHLPALLSAVAQEIAAGEPDPFLTVRNLRLTAEQAAEITATLTALALNAPQAGPREPRYGLLLGFYRKRDTAK
jgi:DNA-binding transcriptional ArsR family regulator